MTYTHTSITPHKFLQARSQLYLISEGTDGPIKIGRSISAKNRLHSIQTGNPRPLKILAAWEDEYEDICFAEQSFILEWSYHFKPSGEWFYIDEALVLDCMPDFFISIGLNPIRVI
jgi:hypothetical protein